MERVPAYLVVYLLKIRKHAGEFGYLAKRFEGIGPERAVYESTMLAEAEELHLLGLSKQRDEVAYETAKRDSVFAPRYFMLFARWHYLWLEWLGDGIKWLLAAVVGGLIATAISA